MKIQKRLLLSIIPVVILSISILAIVSIKTYSNIIENQVKNNTRLLSNSYSNQINSKLKQIKRSSLDIAAGIVTAINIETVLIDSRKRNEEYSRIFYTSLDGFIKDMTPYSNEFLSISYSQDINWNNALRNKKIYMSNPIEFMGDSVFMVYTPVVIDYVTLSESKAVGVVVMAISTSYFFDDINDVEFGDTGSLFITNKDGLYIYHKDKSKIMSERFVNLKNASNLKSIDDSMKKQKSGLGTYYVGKDKEFVSFAPIEEAGWSLSLTGSYSEFSSQFKPIIFIGSLILLASILFLTTMIFLIVRGVSKPLSLLSDAVEKISEGDLSIRSNLKHKNEVGVLSRSFDLMVDKLEVFNSSLEEEVLNRTQELRAANEELISMNESMEVMNEELISTNETLDSNAREMEAMNEELKVGNESLEEVNEELIQTVEELEVTKNSLWSEMELAHKLQTILLPHDPRINGFEIAAFMKTTSSVGGDYYDVINVDGKNWFLIGDVSGHGVTAGLIMMMVQTSIHVALSQCPNSKPEELLSIINKTIHHNISKLGGNRYMTLTIFACLGSNKISFAGAHLPVIIYRNESDSIELIETNGAWLGLVDDIKNLNSNNELSLNDGDIMLLYTDGISEGLTPDGEHFSQQGLINLFRKSAHLEPKKICKIIKDYTEKLLLDDDVTTMILKKVRE